MKTTIRLSQIVLVLSWLTLSTEAHAVSPSPDGGYPGGNTAEGQRALLSLTSGSYNTAVGFLSLGSDTSNSFNTGIGAGALLANAADQNTATGAGALLSNNTGSYNTGNGAFALFSNTEAAYNTAMGYFSLFDNTGGHDNTAIGAVALPSNMTGNFNVAVGSNAGLNVTTADNVICIGAGIAGENITDSCYIGGIFDRISSGGAAVFINSAGKLGTSTSSRRFKEQIKAMDNASEVLFELKPVTFRYKKELDPQGIPQFGLVAEDVEAVNRDLVVRDKDGRVSTVRYEAVNAMLLNEFLKEHRKMEEQQTAIIQLKREFQRERAEQQKQIEALASGLQKVSAELELTKAAAQTVLNTR